MSSSQYARLYNVLSSFLNLGVAVFLMLLFINRLSILPSKSSMAVASERQLEVVAPMVIDLDLSEELHLDLHSSMKSLGFSGQYSFRCQQTCPPGLALSSEGQLVWSPAVYIIRSRFEEASGSIQAWSDTSEGTRRVLMTWKFVIGDFPYRGGSQWSRFSSEDIRFKRLPASMQLVQYLLAYQSYKDFGRFGTSIYLGRYLGEHLVLTNKHVFDAILINGKAVCDHNRNFLFSSTGIKAHCSRVVLVDEYSDLAILAVKAAPSHSLDAIYRFWMGFRKSLKLLSGEKTKASQLLIAGHGRYRNPSKELRFGYDSDCRYTMHDYEKKLSIKSVTHITSYLFNKNLAPWNKSSLTSRYKRALCDVSPGDSGGPLLRMDTGEFVGILRGGIRRRVTTRGVGKPPKKVSANTSYIPLLTIKRAIYIAISTMPDTKNHSILTLLLDTLQ